MNFKNEENLLTHILNHLNFQINGMRCLKALLFVTISFGSEILDLERVTQKIFKMEHWQNFISEND